MKTTYSQVLLVDDGGYFPETDVQQDAAWFMMDAMKLLNTDAVGVSEKELRFGLGFLQANVKRTQLPHVCANLFEKATKKPVVRPYLVKKVGTVKVGIFGLMTDKADLGPARDSLYVEEPTAAAQRTVAALKKEGATVIVLLSQLGKVEGEDLVTAVDGIDAVIIGRNVPLLQKGRLIKNTVACYGGEQGQYLGRTIIELNAQRKMASGDNETFILGPEVGEKPEILTLVKSFEDGLNEKIRKHEKEEEVKRQAQQGQADNPEHFVGTEICQRCHTMEYEQWKTTGHAQAWQTLVTAKKDATPDCIPCHVVGYKQAGGFQTGDDAPKLGNVQCENCHGMGTQHESWPSQAQRITEKTCVTCHTASNSPVFNFAIYQPHIVHHPPAVMPPLPPNPAKQKMMQSH